MVFDYEDANFLLRITASIAAGINASKNLGSIGKPPVSVWLLLFCGLASAIESSSSTFFSILKPLTKPLKPPPDPKTLLLSVTDELDDPPDELDPPPPLLEDDEPPLAS